jgi:hypothetical protein
MTMLPTSRAGIVSGLLVATSLLLFGPAHLTDARAEDNSPAGGPPQMNSADMQKMMALMQPGPNHQTLGRLAGRWRTTIRLWMGPGKPQVSEGEATYEWTLGSRYLVDHQSGSFNDMPFLGMGITGYDNGKKRYFTCWFDNMGTGMMSLTGQADADGKGWTFHGPVFDPARGKDIPVREELRLDDNDHYTFRMFESMAGPDGKSQDMKVMEIAAVRTE